MNVSPQFVLASASPRRKELLEQIGTHFTVYSVDADETPVAGEAAEDYVVRMACIKAQMGATRFPLMPVLGADTTVVIGGQILGKPASQTDAQSMLMALSGKVHRVLSAIAMVYQNKIVHRLSETQVTFNEITTVQCHRYWQTGEPVDKAGGYAIQGLGAVFIKRINGSYTGVVGLPLAETRELLELFDISYWQSSP